MDWQDTFEQVMTSTIGRLVAAGPALLLPVFGAVSFWLQDKLGINMDPAVAVAFVTTIVTGAALLAWKWLDNRGKFERIVTEMHKLYEAGKELQQPEQPPVAPPGLISGDK
jgi:hypothetical protein